MPKPNTAKLFKLLLSLPLVAVHFCNAANIDSLVSPKDRNYFSLKGAVKSFAAKTYIPPTHTVAFSGTAQAILPNYKNESSMAATFDTTGRLASLTVAAPAHYKSGKITETKGRYYYRNDKLVALARQEEGKPLDSIELRYKRNGKQEYYRIFDARGKVRSQYTFTWRADKLTMMRERNGENFPIGTTKYVYQNDCLSEVQELDDQLRMGKIKRMATRKENNGNTSQSFSTSNGAGKLIEGSTRLRDAAGHLLEESLINDERQVTSSTIFTYNQNGDAVTEKHFDLLGEAMFDMVYQYDNHKNWIQKDMYQSGILVSSTIRTYEYFE
ncbi:MAG: hypothetical protein QM642_11905 [Edaphocola sp.]